MGASLPQIPDQLIAAIRRRVDEINKTGSERFSGLRWGEVITIQDRPFRGYEAIFDASLSSGQEVPLELPAGQIQPKNQ